MTHILVGSDNDSMHGEVGQRVKQYTYMRIITLIVVLYYVYIYMYVYKHRERERAKNRQKTRGNHCLLPVVSFDAVLIACHWHYWLGHIDSVSK